MYTPSFKKTQVRNETPSRAIQTEDTYREPPVILPSERRSIGKISRHFIQHVSDKTIIEVSSTTYQDLLTQQPKYDHRAYTLVTVTWDTTSPKTDLYYGKYIKEGSNTRNMREVDLVEEKMPGLRDYLKTAGELP